MKQKHIFLKILNKIQKKTEHWIPIIYYFRVVKAKKLRSMQSKKKLQSVIRIKLLPTARMMTLSKSSTRSNESKKSIKSSSSSTRISEKK